MMPLWRALRALAVLLPAAGVFGAANLTLVSTPEELVQASNDEAIVITQHLDLRGVTPEELGGPIAFEDIDVFRAAVLFGGATTTVLGRCEEEAEWPLAAPRKAGQCVLVLDGVAADGGRWDYGLYFLNPGDLWLGNLYVLMAEPAAPVGYREALTLEREDQYFPTYVTNVTLESVTGGRVGVDRAIIARSGVVAAGLQVVNFGPSSFEPVWFLYSSEAPDTLIDCDFSGNDASSDPEAVTAGAVYTGNNILLQGCTFSGNKGSSGAAEYDLSANGENGGKVYSDAVVTYYDTDGDMVRDSLPLDDAPPDMFFTLEDEEFMKKRAEVNEALSAAGLA